MTITKTYAVYSCSKYSDKPEKHYKNTSIFSGIVDFSAPAGNFRWLVKEGSLYQLQDGAYVRVASVVGAKSAKGAYTIAGF